MKESEFGRRDFLRSGAVVGGAAALGMPRAGHAAGAPVEALRLSIAAGLGRTAFAAHYLMDSSTPASRARHLARVSAQMERLLK